MLCYRDSRPKALNKKMSPLADFRLDLLKAMHTLIQKDSIASAEELVDSFQREVRALVDDFDGELLFPKIKTIRFQKERIKRFLVGVVEDPSQHNVGMVLDEIQPQEEEALLENVPNSSKLVIKSVVNTMHRLFVSGVPSVQCNLTGVGGTAISLLLRPRM
jgi:hypothetical protein